MCGIRHKRLYRYADLILGWKKNVNGAFAHPVMELSLSLSLSLFRFLEEQNKKAKASENGNDRETKEVNMEQEKVNGTPSAVISESVPKQYDRTSDGHFSMKCILKASPFLSADQEKNEQAIRPEPKLSHKGWRGSDDLSKLKSQVVWSARDLFDERFSQRQYVAYSQAANSGAMTEDLYLSQKQEKMAGIAAAFSKRESAGKFEDLPADVDLKARKMAASSSTLSPSPAQRRNPEREMFTIRRENSPVLVPRTSESKINAGTDFLRESVLGWVSPKSAFFSGCTLTRLYTNGFI